MGIDFGTQSVGNIQLSAVGTNYAEAGMSHQQERKKNLEKLSESLISEPIFG